MEWNMTTPDSNEISKGLVAGTVGCIPIVGSLLSSIVDLFWPSIEENIWNKIKHQVEETARRVAKYEIVKDELDDLGEYLNHVAPSKLEEIEAREGRERYVRLFELEGELYTIIQRSFLQEAENGQKLFMFHPLFPALATLYLTLLADIIECSETDHNRRANQNTRDRLAQQYGLFIYDSFSKALEYRFSLIDFSDESHWIIREFFMDYYLDKDKQRITYLPVHLSLEEARAKYKAQVTADLRAVWPSDRAEIMLIQFAKTAAQNMACYSPAPNTWHLFWHDVQGKVWTQARNGASGHLPVEVPGQPRNMRFTGPLAVCTGAPGAMDLIGHNEIGNLLQLAWCEGKWHGHNLSNELDLLPPKQRFVGGLAACATPTRIDIFGQNPKNPSRLLHLTRVNGQWQPLVQEQTNLFFKRQLAACTRVEGVIDVFGIDTQGILWRLTSEQGKWRSTNLSKLLPGALRDMSHIEGLTAGWFDGQLEVYWTDKNGGLHWLQCVDDEWKLCGSTEQFQLPPATRLRGQVAACSWKYHREIFVAAVAGQEIQNFTTGKSETIEVWRIIQLSGQRAKPSSDLTWGLNNLFDVI
jgi:hypothetical protein